MIFRLAPEEHSRTTESKVVTRIEYNGHYDSVYAEASNHLKFYVSTNDDPNDLGDANNALCKYVSTYPGGNNNDVTLECDTVMQGSYIKVIKERNNLTMPYIALANYAYGMSNTVEPITQPTVSRTIFKTR